MLAGYLVAWAVIGYAIPTPSVPSEIAFVPTRQLTDALALAGLTLLLFAARPLGRGAGIATTALAAGTLALAAAVLDEALQQWIPTRDPSLSALGGKLLGVFGAYVVLAPDAPLRRRWSCHVARVLLVLTVPMLTYAALAPQANALTVEIYRALGLPRGDAPQVAHLTLAALLTALLAMAAPAGRARPRLGAAATLLAMIAMGPLIEHVQSITGRGASADDVIAHNRGVLLALLGWALIHAGRTISALGAADTPRPVDPASEPVTAAPDARADPEQDRDGAPPDGDAEGGRFVGHAVRVATLTLGSRITGLVRDATLAAVFGLSAVADAFFIGFLVPNLFRRLFGEGALAASFIPHYTELLRRDRELARRFASLCLVVLSIVLACVTLVTEFVLAAATAAQWDESTALALRLTMVMLPYMPLVCAVALIGGVLQVHGRFAVTAAAPVLLNLAIIAAAVLAVFGPRPAGSLQEAAFWVAGAVLVAGVGQLLWQLAALRGVARLTLRFNGAGAAFRSMLLMMGPMVAALAVYQINALLDSVIAFVLSPRGDAATFALLGYTLPYPIEVGSVAALQWAQRLYQFPLGVFGIALATAIFPALAHAAAERSGARTPTLATGPDDEVSRILRRGLRLTMFIALPAAVGLVLVRSPLVTLIYQRGAFAPDDAQRVATILAGYAASVWAYSLMHVLTRAFYAHKDAATPLRVSLVMVAANLALNLVLIWPLGAAGLAWSTAATGAIQALALLVLVRRRVARPFDRAVALSWLRTAMLSAAMAAVVAPVMAMMEPRGETLWSAAGVLGVAVMLGAAMVLGGAWVTGAPELRWLLRRRVG